MNAIDKSLPLSLLCNWPILRRLNGYSNWTTLSNKDVNVKRIDLMANCNWTFPLFYISLFSFFCSVNSPNQFINNWLTKPATINRSCCFRTNVVYVVNALKPRTGLSNLQSFGAHSTKLNYTQMKTSTETAFNRISIRSAEYISLKHQSSCSMFIHCSSHLQLIAIVYSGRFQAITTNQQ